MKCQACGRDNRDGAAFCDGCGTPLTARCPTCAADLRPGARFCDACGANVVAGADETPRARTPAYLAQKILKDRDRMQGERRNVTVLFADAKGFTPFSERLDAEKVYSVTQSCIERMVDAVHRHEGTVNQFTGDGIMAIFGAPIAHEDSARRAVSAALEMQEALTAHARDAGVDIGFRVGINTGPVVVGRISDDLEMDYTAVGDTVNLAARMEQMAEEGSVYLTEDTYRQVADYFDFEDLGPRDVKGKSAAVHVYRAVAERGIKTRIDAAVARGLSPFVGRDRDVDVLKGLWEDALTGRGQIVMVSGEPGIGKSRLLLEFRRELGNDVIWREAHCISYGENIPYLPVIELVKNGFGITDADDEGTMIAKVDADTAMWSGEAQKMTSYLKFLLQIDPGDATVENMDPLERRAGILDALRALILERSKVAPRVVVVEDLHWADDQSEEAFRVCADAIAASKVLMILTFRPGYMHPSGDLPNAHRIVLAGLDGAARAALASATLSASHLPADLAGPVTAKAEGNPLFIEEVTKALAAGVADPSAVPNSLQDVILARIDRLARGARESLQLASVIGREFTLRLLNRISDLESELEGVLIELKMLELIYEKAFFPELAYMFKHALTHDVAYSTLLVERRKALHRIVAMAIEELYPDRIHEHYETLAHHYLKAEDGDRAIEYLALSADKAAAAHAVAQAAAFLGTALTLSEQLDDPIRTARLAHRRGMIHLTAFAIAEATEDFDRMLAAAEASGDDHSIAWAYGGRAVIDFFAHEFEAGRRSAQSALELADGRFEDVAFEANIALAGINIVTGRRDEGFTAYHSAKRVMSSSSELLLVVIAGELEVLQANWLGDYDRAISIFNEWMRRLDEHGSLVTVPTSWSGAVALGGRGDYEHALRISNDVIVSCERTEAFPDFRARALNTNGWLYSEIENHARAVEWNERGLEAARQIPSADPEFTNNALLNLGDALVALGEFDRAEVHYAEVEATVNDPKPADHWMLWRYSQHLFHSVGEFWRARARPELALDYAKKCVDASQRTGSLKNLVKGQRLLGQTLAALGEHDQATKSLDEALVVARRIANPPQLWKTLVAAAEVTGNAALYREALTIIDGVAENLTDDELRKTFLGSPHVTGIRAAST